MLISNQVTSGNMLEKSLGNINKIRRLTDKSIDQVIQDSLNLEKVDYSLFGLNLIIKKSKFPDSKFKDYRAIQKMSCIINMDIELLKNNDARFMFKRINSIWNSYNKQEDWNSYKTLSGIVNTNAYVERVKERKSKVVNSHKPVINNNVNESDFNISIIIPAYNASAFIEECLDSIMSQDKPAHRILLGIDACEKTLEKVKSISHKYHNLEVYYADVNTGPYLVINSLIQKIPNDEYFITFGADDVMHSNLISTMSCNNDAKISKHDGVLFIRKDRFNTVGGYRSWRCAADTDMIFRLRKKIGRVIRIPILYDRGEHDGQLTNTITSMSELRQSYIKIIHENEKARRPELHIKPEFNKLTMVETNKKQITVNMATYPARQYSFKPCMKKMLEHDFIDKFRIYLNEFKEIPADFPTDPRIEYLIGVPNIKDSGKFHWAYTNKNEYYFTVDDDLFYPADFFTEHINSLNKYNGEILVTIHGKRVPVTPKNFHDTLKPAYHCIKDNPTDVWVHLGGTGVMVFDNNKIKLPKDLIKKHGMCDLWLGQYAQLNNIPILCRQHKADHIQAIDIGNKDTLFEKRHEMWNDQIRILQSVKWKLNTK